MEDEDVILECGSCGEETPYEDSCCECGDVICESCSHCESSDYCWDCGDEEFGEQ